MGWRALAAAAALVVLVVPAARADGPVFGVSEDAAKYADDGGQKVYDDLKSLGMTEIRWVVYWDGANPETIQEKPFLDRSVPVAQRNNIAVVFSVQALHPTDYTAPGADDRLCAYMARVARTYPYVTQFIVGNEPNQPRFWQPQFAGGKNVSGAAYETLLAKCYDALKAVNPGITVIGVGLSPRGNDNPNAPNNISTSPVRFIKYMGDAYRASGRTKPIMDLFALHLYPNDASKDTPDTKVVWPNVSFATLDRLQQAVWDAFHGTGQPTFEAGTTRVLRSSADLPPPIKWKLDEIGWQTDILDLYKSIYSGKESIKPTSEAKQAAYYANMIQEALCNSLIAELLYFHLIDETDLDRFQSGVERANGTPKPAFDAVRKAIGDACDEEADDWKHDLRPQLLNPFFHIAQPAVDLTFDPLEAATADSMIIDLGSNTFDPQNPADRAKFGTLFGPRSLQSANAAGLKIVARTAGPGPANPEQQVRHPLAERPGRYGG